MNKRILFFSHQKEVGGGEKSIIQLMSNLDTSYKPIALISKKSKYYEEVKKKNIECIFLEMPDFFIEETFKNYKKTNFMKKIITFVLIFFYGIKLRKLLKINEIDILHTNTLKASLIALVSNFPKHVIHIYHDRTGTKSVLHNLIQKKVHKIIAISEYVKNKYPNSNNVVRIYNGTEPFNVENKEIKQKIFKVGVIGRTVEWKGQDTLINAGIEILKNNSNFKFYIIGSSDIENGYKYIEKLKRLVHDTPFSENFIFKDFVSDIEKEFLNLDLVVAPSKEPEPFGRVIIESGMAIKPIIGTNIGGMPELIFNDYNGYLIEPNDEQQLAELIIRVAENENKYNYLAQNNYIQAKKFSIKKHAEEIKKLYDKAVMNGE